MTQQLIKSKSLKDLVQQDAVKARLRDIMGQRSGQFAAALVQIVNGGPNAWSLQKCTPESILGSALMAAALDLSVDPNLGEAHLVPYKDRCTLQIGYVGLAQLAMRSGQYKNLGWKVVYEGELIAWDELSGDLDIDRTIKKSDSVIGYAAKFRLINGFERGEFWTVDEIEEHAKRYSQAYRAALADTSKQDSSPWFRDRERMSLKTVLKSLLKTWGPKSIQMQKALKVDEGAVLDVDSEAVEYPDNDYGSKVSAPVFDSPPAETPKEAEPKPKPEPKATKKAPETENPAFKVQKAVRGLMENAGITEDQLVSFLHAIGFLPENVTKMDQFAQETWDMIYSQSNDLFGKIKETQQ
jgi:recombination protein RecT